MVDKAALGVEGTEFEVRIEIGKVREFAEALHSTDPHYLSAAEPVAPPTFLTTTFFWERRTQGSNPWAQVKMDQKRGVHAEQEYTYYGPPPKVGTVLTARSRVADIYEKEGRRGGVLAFAEMITEYRDESGRLVAEARLVGVETEVPPSGDKS